jgi:hypothetical protein
MDLVQRGGRDWFERDQERIGDCGPVILGMSERVMIPLDKF